MSPLQLAPDTQSMMIIISLILIYKVKVIEILFWYETLLYALKQIPLQYMKYVAKHEKVWPAQSANHIGTFGPRNSINDENNLFDLGI